MSRTGLGRGKGWAMECDICFQRVPDVRPRDDDFPLIEFADKGWMIGSAVDACPVCVAQGKEVSEPQSREQLLKDLKRTAAHCLHYYSRLPQSVAVGQYVDVIAEVIAEAREGK